MGTGLCQGMWLPPTPSAIALLQGTVHLLSLKSQRLASHLPEEDGGSDGRGPSQSCQGTHPDPTARAVTGPLAFWEGRAGPRVCPEEASPPVAMRAVGQAQRCPCPAASAEVCQQCPSIKALGSIGFSRPRILNGCGSRALGATLTFKALCGLMMGGLEQDLVLASAKQERGRAGRECHGRAVLAPGT